MAKTVSIYDPIELRMAYHRARSRARRLAQEAAMLAIGCAAMTLLALVLYLVAPPELRAAILSAFLAFDLPGTAIQLHPPLSLW